MNHRTKLPPNLHFFLGRMPTDSTLVIESLVDPKGQHAGDRKTRQRCNIDFSVEDIKEIRVIIKGKKKLEWKP